LRQPKLDLLLVKAPQAAARYYALGNNTQIRSLPEVQFHPSSVYHDVAGLLQTVNMPARTVSISAGAGDFAQLSSLTNLNDINRLLHETIAWERSIESDLDKQLVRRTELERDILQLNAATTEVH
jgi:hypothetical protein